MTLRMNSLNICDSEQYFLSHIAVIFDSVVYSSLTGSVIMDILFGMEPDTEVGKRYFQIIEDAVQIGSELASTGSYIGKLFTTLALAESDTPSRS